MHTNRLSQEKSPYLLQHAHNPVDWYPWGPEAFEKAKKEDKPILVSTGYSTCHWCHVMERESFENEEVAALMNEYLVSIKVDREERPDIDKIYMTAVSAMTGQGGWPLNAFLTPDLKPFFGGTYFPPEAKFGHPAWRDIVRHIGEAWKSSQERAAMLESASHITTSLESYLLQARPAEQLDPQWLDGGFQALSASFDASRGGFSPAPKFPMPVYHHFLMRYAARTKSTEALRMSLETLRRMAEGGIYDQVGGGFARYSTDAHWHVPHFEKMLYDNAQLAVNYLEAYQITKDPEFRRIARETLDYVLRDMRSPEGGFYSAEDADSLPVESLRGPAVGGDEAIRHDRLLRSARNDAKKEGAFYVWEKGEIERLLGAKTAELFNFRFGVRDKGNAAQDPHGEFTNKNILYIAHPLPEVAQHFKRSVSDIEMELKEALKVLFVDRKKRPRPHLDDKVISAWNGLMISAFAKAYQILGEPKDLEAAEKAAEFIKGNLYDAKSKLLYRRWRGGEKQAFGIADDYAFVVQGLLDLYEAGHDVEWISFADELTRAMIQRFYDKDKGGFFMTAADQDASMLLRFKEDQDNVEPAASSVGVLNLLRLSQFLDKTEYQEMAVKTLEGFGGTLKNAPRALPAMLSALDFATSAPRQIVVAGELGDADTKALLRIVCEHFLPVKVLVAGVRLLPAFSAVTPVAGKSTAYVCEHFSCQKPTSDPHELEKLIVPGLTKSLTKS